MRPQDFDQIHCIVLDKNYISHFYPLRDTVEDKFGRIPYAFVNGYGQLLEPNLYDQLNSFAVPSSWKNSLGSYFHCRAMKNILKKALGEGLDHVLILEDDAVFLDNFDEVLDNAMGDLESMKWDLLYYGCNHSSCKVTSLSPNLLRLKGGYTTHAVGIRSTVFQKIIDLPEENTIDDMMSRYLIPHVTALALWPNVCVQRPGYSNLQYHNVDYSEYFLTKGQEAEL